MQALTTLDKKIKEAKAKFTEHAERKFSPAAAAAAAAEGGSSSSSSSSSSSAAAAAAASSGHKRSAAVAGALKSARAAEAEEHLDAYIELSEDEDGHKKKKHKKTISSANDYLATLPREVLKVLRTAGIINSANLLAKPKVLSDSEYASLARLTDKVTSNLFKQLEKWRIILPAEQEEEEDEDEDEDEDEEEEDDDFSASEKKDLKKGGETEH